MTLSITRCLKSASSVASSAGPASRVNGVRNISSATRSDIRALTKCQPSAAERRIRVDRPRRSILATVPVSTRQEQEITGLEDFVEDRSVLRRRHRYRHADHGIRNGRTVNLPALNSLHLEDDEILRIVVELECTLFARRDDHADLICSKVRAWISSRSAARCAACSSMQVMQRLNPCAKKDSTLAISTLLSDPSSKTSVPRAL